MSEMAKIFTGESCKPNRRIPLNVQLLRPYKGHILAILGPYFVYFKNISASRLQIWLKFSLESHGSQTEDKFHSISNYWDHIRAIPKPYKDHVLTIFTIFMLPDALKAQNFTEESCTANIHISSNVELLRGY